MIPKSQNLKGTGKLARSSVSHYDKVTNNPDQEPLVPVGYRIAPLIYSTNIY